MSSMLLSLCVIAESVTAADQAGGAQIIEVAFSNTWPVYRDRLAFIYPNWHHLTYPAVWLDRNEDGDAEDWMTVGGDPFAGDIRGPLCYTANVPVTVSTCASVSHPQALYRWRGLRSMGAISERWGTPFQARR